MGRDETVGILHDWLVYWESKLENGGVQPKEVYEANVEMTKEYLRKLEKFDNDKN